MPIRILMHLRGSLQLKHTMRIADKNTTLFFKNKGRAMGELDVINLCASRQTVLDRGLEEDTVPQLKLVVSGLIRTVLWCSVQGFPCGFLIRWLCAQPDCSFVVRHDRVRAEKWMCKRSEKYERWDQG